MKKTLKIIFLAGVAVIVALFLLSVTGIIENNGEETFGFPYKNAYTSFLLAMALVYLVIWLIGYLIFKKPIDNRVKEIERQNFDNTKKTAELLTKQLIR